MNQHHAVGLSAAVGPVLGDAGELSWSRRKAATAWVGTADAHRTPRRKCPLGLLSATLGLLAFLLAFTFGLAASRFDARREVLQEEVNAIGTAYLRASFLPDNQGPEVRALLREYVDLRLAATQPNSPMAEVLQKSEALHEKLWNEAVAAGLKKDTVMVAPFVDALNQVIDVHAKRVTAGARWHSDDHLVGPLLCDDSVNGRDGVPRWAHRHGAIHRGIGNDSMLRGRHTADC